MCTALPHPCLRGFRPRVVKTVLWFAALTAVQLLLRRRNRSGAAGARWGLYGCRSGVNEKRHMAWLNGPFVAL